MPGRQMARTLGWKQWCSSYNETMESFPCSESKEAPYPSSWLIDRLTPTTAELSWTPGDKQRKVSSRPKLGPYADLWSRKCKVLKFLAWYHWTRFGVRLYHEALELSIRLLTLYFGCFGLLICQPPLQLLRCSWCCFSAAWPCYLGLSFSVSDQIRMGPLSSMVWLNFEWATSSPPIEERDRGRRLWKGRACLYNYVLLLNCIGHYDYAESTDWASLPEWRQRP